MPQKFRKKPVAVEAVRWTGDNTDEVFDFVGSESGCAIYPLRGIVVIPTLEGSATASAGDWIIKGVEGEFYPCNPRIFRKTYEKVDE